MRQRFRPGSPILSSEDFRYFDSHGGNKVRTREAGGIPLVTWPDGRWCYDVNGYIRDGFLRGLSRNDRGGTLGQYAFQLQPLIRYCFSKKIDFVSSTDNDFKKIINSLKDRKKKFSSGISVKPISDDSIIDIGKRMLDFLLFVGSKHGVANFVGRDGVIKGYLKKVKRPGEYGFGEYWTHASFPVRGPKKKRLPISDKTIAALRKTAAKDANSFLRKRKLITMKLFEVIGGRRLEISRLLVADVVAAMDDFRSGGTPFLRISTVKQGRERSEAFRVFPLVKEEIEELYDYVTLYREVAIQKWLEKNMVDHGVLLISNTTGGPLSANTLTNELRELGVKAGLKELASPHLFRHRMLTLHLKRMRERISIGEKDGFYNAHERDIAILMALMQMSGHRSLQGVAHYLSADEINSKALRSASEKVELLRRAESVAKAIEELEATSDSTDLDTEQSVTMELLKVASELLKALIRS